MAIIDDLMAGFATRRAREQAVIAEIKTHFSCTYIGGAADGAGTYYGAFGPGRNLFTIVPPEEDWSGDARVEGIEPEPGVYRLIIGEKERARAPTIKELAEAFGR